MNRQHLGNNKNNKNLDADFQDGRRFFAFIRVYPCSSASKFQNRIFSRRLRIFVMTLLLLGLFSPSMSTPAQAADGGYAYHWLLRFDFAKDATGELVIDVGYNNNGVVQNPPLYSRSFPVSCKPVGAVGVAGGVASFNGGYFQCTLDIKDALDQTFTECGQRHRGCALKIGEVETYRSVLLKADLASPPGVLAPLFAHPSAAYAVQLLTVQAQLKTQLPPLGAVDSPMLVLNAPTTSLQPYTARWGCNLAGACGAYFDVGAPPVYVDTPDLPMNFATPSTTIYIGRDLLGNTISAGSTLDNLIVDPGNGLPG